MNKRVLILAVICLAGPLLAAEKAPILTPNFKETVDLSFLRSRALGEKGIHFTRNTHPLDHLNNPEEKTSPQPLAQIRRIAFALRLENEVRLYRAGLSSQKLALEEAVSFYEGLLEHAHRLANRSVRICAYQLGLPYEKLSHFKITVAGPLPQTIEDYQRWATRPDPAPCHRDALWSKEEAEKVTRYHHLQRKVKNQNWPSTETRLKWDVQRELKELKNELDGSMFIQDLKMSQVDTIAPTELLVPIKKFPTVKQSEEFPAVKVVTPGLKSQK